MRSILDVPLLIGTCFFQFVSAFALTASAQDAVLVDPKHHVVEFENDNVRVLRLKFEAGDTSPEHEHPSRLTIFLQEYGTTNRLANGTIDRRRRPAGDIEWRGPVKHVPYADVAYENIQVEIKSKNACYGSLALPLDLVRVDPTHFKVGFENKYVRAVRLKFGPRERSPMHEHAAGVLVFITDFHWRLLRPNGSTSEEIARAGMVSWRPAGTLAIENLTEATQEAILVEIK